MKGTTAAVATLVMLVALVGCSPSTGPTPSPTATSTQAPPADPLAPPTPLLDTDCAELAAASTVAPLFAQPVAPRHPAIAVMAATSGIPDDFFIRQLGGISCEWSNGVPRADETGFAADYAGLRLTVVDAMAADWTRFVDAYGVTGDRLLTCTTSGASACESNLLVAGQWLSVQADSLAAGTDTLAIAAFTPVVDAAAAVISSANPSGEPWSPPSGTLPLGDSCADLVDDATVAAALGLSAPVAAVSPQGGWSSGAGAQAAVGGIPCLWLLEGGESGVGALTRLPGGAWAWAEAESNGSVAGAAALELEGMSDTDEASLRCTAGEAECLADLIIGGNWLQVSLWPEAEAVAATPRTVAIVTIAEAVVDRIR